jgi:hypothetical protein
LDHVPGPVSLLSLIPFGQCIFSAPCVLHADLIKECSISLMKFPFSFTHFVRICLFVGYIHRFINAICKLSSINSNLWASFFFHFPSHFASLLWVTIFCSSYALLLFILCWIGMWSRSWSMFICFNKGHTLIFCECA